MAVFVDSCVLLNVFTEDPRHHIQRAILGVYKGILAATLRQRHGSALRRAADLWCQRGAGRNLRYGSRRKNFEIVKRCRTMPRELTQKCERCSG